MSKQVRTPLIPSANGAAESGGASSRTIVQAFFEPGEPDSTSGPPTAGAGSPQVVGDARLTARGTSLVRAETAVTGAPKALPDIAKIAQGPREAPPSLGPDDAQSRDDDAWQVYSDLSFTSEGYLPGESPFEPPNCYPSGPRSADKFVRITPSTSPRGVADWAGFFQHGGTENTEHGAPGRPTTNWPPDMAWR